MARPGAVHGCIPTPNPAIGHIIDTFVGRRKGEEGGSRGEQVGKMLSEFNSLQPLT